MKKLLLLTFITSLLIVYDAKAQDRVINLSKYVTEVELKKIPEVVFNSKESLEELYLAGNNFSELPMSMATLKNLIKLDLTGSLDPKQPEIIFKPLISLTKLRSLAVGGKVIQKSNLDELIQLEKLYWHGLDTFPGTFCKLINLKEIYLETVENFQYLPEEFTSLTNLERITIRSREFETLPITGFGKLTKLQLLDLKFSKNKALPTDFSELKNLRILDMEYSGIESLPNGFGSLENLEVLNLSFTNLSKLSPDFHKLSKLKRLHLDNSDIAELPHNFGNLKQLEELYISSTRRLKHFPASFSKLHSLTRLNMVNSSLESFPEELYELSNLKLLILSNHNLIMWGITQEEIMKRMPDCEISVHKY